MIPTYQVVVFGKEYIVGQETPVLFVKEIYDLLKGDLRPP